MPDRLSGQLARQVELLVEVALEPCELRDSRGERKKTPPLGWALEDRSLDRVIKSWRSHLQTLWLEATTGPASV